jgi:hypothetical protein
MSTAPSNPDTAAALVLSGNAGKKHPLMAPIDMSKVTNEKGVKQRIRQLLDFHGWFHWMPGASGYGTQGISDHLALKAGVFLAIEAKYGHNKPKPLQKAFAAQVFANDAFAFCVTEKNIDHLAMWLESFEISNQAQAKAMSEGRDPETAVPAEHGSRMLNAISVLTDAFAE